jgi:hypothetical protein
MVTIAIMMIGPRRRAVLPTPIGQSANTHIFDGFTSPAASRHCDDPPMLIMLCAFVTDMVSVNPAIAAMASITGAAASATSAGSTILKALATTSYLLGGTGGAGSSRDFVSVSLSVMNSSVSEADAATDTDAVNQRVSVTLPDGAVDAVSVTASDVDAESVHDA